MNINKEFTATFECTKINNDMIAQMIEPAIDVVVANPRDVEKLDLNQIYNHVWFISDYACEEGTMALITGKKDKLMFIKQGLKHPEMVLKGKL